MEDLGVNVEEEGKIGEFGSHFSNRHFATGQSMINSDNQQTIQQATHKFQDSEVKDTIIDFEAPISLFRQNELASSASQGGDKNESLTPKSWFNDLNNQKLPVLRQESGQSDESNGISFITDLSIADHGYASDLSKVATGSGNIGTPRVTLENQGHNFAKNSDINQNQFIIVTAIQ